MAALDYLHQAGLTVELTGEKLRLSPAERITDVVRLYVREHREELIVELNASNDPSYVWLHLLVLANGDVLQMGSGRKSAEVAQHAHEQYQEHLLTVLAVPSFDRVLREDEIVKALAGTLTSPAPATALPITYLARVARKLGVAPGLLLEQGFIDQQDMLEMAFNDPGSLVKLIRSNPAWDQPAKQAECITKGTTEYIEEQPQHFILTAATATTEWRAARDQYIQHRMNCPVCRAPKSLLCSDGTALRQQYENAPMESRQ